MALSTDTPLKLLSEELRPGMAVGSDWLARRGISPQLAYSYTKSGWLERLARGVYAKPGQPLGRDFSLCLLVELGYHVHVGGKTALAWHGYRHNLSMGGELLTLYKLGGRGLPEWFTTRFRCRINSRRLFEEPTKEGDATIFSTHVQKHIDHAGVPVSEPERATLEMLSEIPGEQSLEEAEQLMESLVSLRRDPMHELLMHCKNRKTVALFFHFARKFSLPVLENLSAEHLPARLKSRYVLKLPRGTLVLKP